ncbi:MAG: hypothetical protein ACP5QY_10990, partial [Candidatus Hydrogenedens sp.]
MKFFIKLCKYLFFYLIIPLLILAGIEGFLRYKGWGENRFPWREQVVGDKRIYTKNIAFYQQFFEHPVNPLEYEPHITVIQLPKPDNTIRIFVFGESAALGWPDSSYSMGKFLEVMLNMLYPEHRWEVFNLCFAGINSHILRYLVENSLFLQPDLVIFYMGNNETHGTFGLLHSFKNSIPFSPWIVQTHIYLQNFYLVQQLRKWAISLRITSPQKSTHTIRWDDPKVDMVKNNFEKNLKSIINTLTQKHIPIFISTMGANLRDWQPIESWFRSDITNAEAEKWNEDFNKGLDFLKEKNIIEAKNAFTQAMRIDSSPAILNFFFAWSLLAENNTEEARKYFLEACDKDGFGFVRAKPFINQTITKIAQEYSQSQNLSLIPVTQTLSQHAIKNIPGNDLFIDSCHLNFYGSYLIACAYLHEIIHYYSLKSFPIPSFEDVKIRLGITKNKEQEYYVHAYIESPTNLIYFPNECKTFNYKEILTQLKENVLPFSPREAVHEFHYDIRTAEMLFEILNTTPNDINLSLICLDILNNLGSFRQGISKTKRLCKIYPENINLYYLLFIFAYYADDKETVEYALDKIKKSVIYPHDIYLNLSLKWAIKQDKKEKAIEISKKLIAEPYSLPFRKTLAQCVLINENKNLSFQQKITQWKEVLQKSPWSFDSFEYISNQAQSRAEKELLKETLLEIIQKDTQSELPYSFLSNIYEDENQIRKSIELLRKAISVSPSNIYNYYKLTCLFTKEAEELLSRGDIEQGNCLLEEAVQIFPYYAP